MSIIAEMIAENKKTGCLGFIEPLRIIRLELNEFTNDRWNLKLPADLLSTFQFIYPVSFFSNITYFGLL